MGESYFDWPSGQDSVLSLCISYRIIPRKITKNTLLGAGKVPYRKENEIIKIDLIT